jgi:hypothetical protein
MSPGTSSAAGTQPSTFVKSLCYYHVLHMLHMLCMLLVLCYQQFCNTLPVSSTMSPGQQLSRHTAINIPQVTMLLPCVPYVMSVTFVTCVICGMLLTGL